MLALVVATCGWGWVTVVEGQAAPLPLISGNTVVYVSASGQICFFDAVTNVADICVTDAPSGAHADAMTRISDDGGSVAFVRDDHGDGYRKLMVIGSDGVPRDISFPYGVSTEDFPNYAWSPSSSTLVFSAIEPRSAKLGLAVVNQADSTQRILPNTESCYAPVWRNPASIVAFCSLTGFGVYTIDASGLNPPFLLTPIPAFNSALRPSLSPNGQYLAFYYEAPGSDRISILVEDLLQPSQSPTTVYTNVNNVFFDRLVWSPTGNRLAFSGSTSVDKDGIAQFGIFFYSAGASLPATNKTAGKSGSYEMVDWAPTGCQALVSTPSGLAIANSELTQVTSLNRGIGYNDADWSPVLGPDAQLCAPARTPSRMLYVAAGDSIPAGADLSGAKSKAYPAFVCDHLPAKPKCRNLSHSGDTTDDFIRDQLPVILRENPELITITIGADDIFRTVRRIWLGCDVQPSRVNLAFLLTSILSRTNARIVVTEYYNPVNPSNDVFPLYLWRNVEACIAEGNNVIHDAVLRLLQTWPNRLVGVPLQDLFAGHEYGTRSSWISACTGNCRFVGFGGIHPNAAGQRAIGQAITAALR